MKLRDALLDALEHLPGPKRTFAIHVLYSASKTTTDVFTYVSPRPKWTQQEIFVLCSEEIEDGKRVFDVALEAALYTHAPTRTALLYIAKVDSTGQARTDAPAPTRALASAFVRYFADPRTRPAWFAGAGASISTAVPDSDKGSLFVHVFARAQGQYLFPNSADYAGKRVRSDAALNRWWRSCLSEAARDLPSPSLSKLYYLVPGLDADEAARVLGGVVPPGWTYGHPYNDADIPFPFRGRAPGVAGLIPWFEDDAKSRFIDDLAATYDNFDGGAPPPSPRKKGHKRARIEKEKDSDDEEIERNAAAAVASKSTSAGLQKKSGDAKTAKEKEKRMGDLARVDADEFWERMGFRQECSQGAITGFFVCAFSSSAPRLSPPASTPVPASTNTLPPPSPSTDATAAIGAPPTSTSTSTAPRIPLEIGRGIVSRTIIERVRSSLMKQQEFSSRERAVRSTGIVEELIHTLLSHNVTSQTETHARKRSHDEVDAEHDADVYSEYLYGTRTTRGEEISSTGGAKKTTAADAPPAVTILTVRKKKK
ncbi:hypothetical protein EXIGLDRAFT_747979 [Exidia glandulosa HHB12029]|uniref:histone acetyltransferase n=1 Tax=Exidia glandulosa HHB12029 TaxID=1314781 RepID=A0A165K5B4_EXIGL|nr:hypothetical protein EXIGLDRAFT_747979 [Exidia glandulosa HHB12029]